MLGCAVLFCAPPRHSFDLCLTMSVCHQWVWVFFSLFVCFCFLVWCRASRTSSSANTTPRSAAAASIAPLIPTPPHTEFSSPHTTIAHRLLHLALHFATAQPHTAHLLLASDLSTGTNDSHSHSHSHSHSGSGSGSGSWALREQALQWLKHVLWLKPQCSPLLRGHELFGAVVEAGVFWRESWAQRALWLRRQTQLNNKHREALEVQVAHQLAGSSLTHTSSIRRSPYFTLSGPPPLLFFQHE